MNREKYGDLNLLVGEDTNTLRVITTRGEMWVAANVGVPLDLGGMVVITKHFTDTLIDMFHEDVDPDFEYSITNPMAIRWFDAQFARLEECCH